jgi:hypothetical protein
LDTVTYALIKGGTFTLGWRFQLPADLAADPDALDAAQAYITYCSPQRVVTVPSFYIATEAAPLEDLVGNPYDLKVFDLASLCNLLDSQLEPMGLRLPTEDELEIAAGGTLFPWGDRIPDGIPYKNETAFDAHRKPNAFGLRFLANPYRTEVSRSALKFGDGGSAICGGEPWPLAWIAMSNCYRLSDSAISDCFPETLEEAFVRPVRRR